MWKVDDRSSSRSRQTYQNKLFLPCAKTKTEQQIGFLETKEKLEFLSDHRMSGLERTSLFANKDPQRYIKFLYDRANVTGQ